MNSAARREVGEPGSRRLRPRKARVVNGSMAAQCHANAGAAATANAYSLEDMVLIPREHRVRCDLDPRVAEQREVQRPRRPCHRPRSSHARRALWMIVPSTPAVRPPNDSERDVEPTATARKESNEHRAVEPNPHPPSVSITGTPGPAPGAFWYKSPTTASAKRTSHRHDGGEHAATRNGPSDRRRRGEIDPR